ncbi:MAG: glycosyltransferase [Lachnospiraceae bacterium]|nr:glycosyltransferase [Lachnospiraceae bacterium]
MTVQQSEKKKLLLIVPTLHQGGYERICVETARLLSDAFQVTLVIFNDKDRHYDASGIDLINIDVPAKDGKLIKAWNLFRRVRKVRRIRRRKKIDLVYSFGISANLVNVFSRGKGKTVTGLRCSTDMEGPRNIRLFTGRSDLILTCSKELMRQVNQEYRFFDTRCIYNPLAVERVQTLSEEEIRDFPFAGDAIVIAAMARDDRIKGHWHLIKAFHALTKKNADVRLMILGDGTYREAKELCRELQIEDRVAFTGAKKNPFPYIRRADLYVLASNHEGFPNALVEAMALGKPVIAADCKTGPREILLSDEEHEKLLAARPDASSTRDVIEGAYGMLVPDMDDAPDYRADNITADDMMLCSAMRRMLSDGDMMKRYAGQSLIRAAQFSSESYREDLERILTDVLDEKEGRGRKK